MSSLFDYTIVKYAIVGSSGLLLDFITTWLCKEKWNINKYIANSLGFCIAVTNNFLLNKYWTFASSNTAIQSQYLYFFGIALIGLLLNNAVIYTFQKIIQTNFYYLKVIAILIVFIWNYLANLFFTFK
jgi:putative flippase GtrA